MSEQKDYWKEFKGEVWKREINVRDFIQRNYTPYDGDESFLEEATGKTKKVWSKLTEMFKVEREKGVYDAETKNPQGIDTYGPGYIDQKNEVIVGVQTDAPLKRGIFPKGGIRMVENSLNAYGYELDPMTKE
ncbi:MAG: formate acetyltransferase, partial [Tannerellaceae bacterium]|nr:formate acetyltransferase [Tannerellaceae bacterium]